MLLWIFMCKSLCRYMFFFLILLGTYLGMELFSYTVTLCLTLWETVMLFIKVVVPLYIPTINVWVLIFLHPHQSLPHTMFFFYHNMLVGVKWYLILVLIYVSLMLNDVEHVIMCSSAICISYLEKCWFIYFAYLRIKDEIWHEKQSDAGVLR